MIRLHGKVVFISGGSSGIGRAAAVEFAKHDAIVALADVDIAGGEDTAGRTIPGLTPWATHMPPRWGF